VESFSPSEEHVLANFNARDNLPMWVIYRPTTLDFPGKWLARMFLTIPSSGPTDHLIVGASLEEIRARLPHGLTNLGRMLGDDPVIEEVWV
jgi:hypothetical protein